MTLINDYAPLLLRICLVALFPFSGLDNNQLEFSSEAGWQYLESQAAQALF